MADETVSDSKDISKETASLSLEEKRSPGGREGKIDKDDFSVSQSTETAAQKPEDGNNGTKVEVEPKSKEEELKENCRDMFSKIAKYMEGELSASMESYTLLETLNSLTSTKYCEMSDVAKTLIKSMEELDGKYKSLQPYLDQIDKLEESVASLEQAAYRLDSYSKRLEDKFKKLEKR